MTRIKNLREYGFSTDNKTYIIAEIGINHGGDVDMAKKLIDSAARTGVDAVKFQTYITEKRVPDPDNNKDIFEILKKCELPFEAFGDLKKYAESQEVDFFSTPFDKESIDYLESIHIDLYKIASFDVVNHKLLQEVASKCKPVILSVGMANHSEISKAYDILKKGTDKIAILHCVSSYPLSEDKADLSSIYTLQDSFDCVIGYSDHTPDIKVPLYAVAAGAQIIEKHYQIDEAMDCIDAPVSITENQMNQYVSNVRNIENIFGKGQLCVREVEQPITAMRRPNV
jgi:N,N'-diacetyllegionaminate synthase